MGAGHHQSDLKTERPGEAGAGGLFPSPEGTNSHKAVPAEDVGVPRGPGLCQSPLRTLGTPVLNEGSLVWSCGHSSGVSQAFL